MQAEHEAATEFDFSNEGGLGGANSWSAGHKSIEQGAQCTRKGFWGYSNRWDTHAAYILFSAKQVSMLELHFEFNLVSLIEPYFIQKIFKNPDLWIGRLFLCYLIIENLERLYKASKDQLMVHISEMSVWTVLAYFAANL